MQQTKNIWIGVGIIALLVIALSWYFFGSSAAPSDTTLDATTTSTTPPPAAAASTGSGSASGSTNTQPPAPAPGVAVSYTSSGFSPTRLEIKAGKAVTFTNNSSGSMRLVSAQVPTIPGQPNPGFDQGKSVARGGTFTYVFTIAGEWGYRNLNKPDHVGTIVVTP